jgi:hypothetical protein
MAGKQPKKPRPKRGLNKRLAPDELLKVSDGTVDIYVVPARHDSWQIVAPPQFKITTETKPKEKP